ncbi:MULTISPECIES: hypothetical protein [Geobacillus]|uniref:hypothetical protein n=1 Tax=Geobacillus TaxID=129337 RepID=UPI0006E56EBE|nr:MULTISPECIES: hypothetical protein [Geobacillus]KQB91897.1 hypothetical protein GEPA3_3036 [Geobacillus sp. PA-3]MED4916729.1 hypothetical protein [Geobacillus thermodenitrificans]
MEVYERLKKFLIENLSVLRGGTSIGGLREAPKFDLFPSDYLKFAEEELELSESSGNNVRAKINCILHLKRALDCQLDVFFERLGFSEYLKKKNLGINSKLKFLTEAGIIKSRSIERFNTIRNKVEHHYQIPEVEDIEVYFDLITTLIANIEMTILALYSNREMTISSFPEDNKSLKMELAVFKDKPSIDLIIQDADETFNATIDIDQREEFLSIFKIYILLTKRESFASEDYIISQL